MPAESVISRANRRSSSSMPLCVVRNCLLLGWVLGQACPTPSFGWGREGHRIVARIAELRLSPEAKVAVLDLLGHGARLSDDAVASWADDVREDRPNTKPWHFVDIPAGARAYDARRDCKDGDCVVGRIDAFARRINDPHLSKGSRREALKFLEHFVADLHQPLHCAERANGRGKLDQGGNLRSVYVPGGAHTTNLHAVWDSYLVARVRKNESVLACAKRLNARVNPRQAKEWEAGRTSDWADESHMLAVGNAYRAVPADGPAPRLTASYVEGNVRVVEAQLARAGVRLAGILNRAFQ